MVPFTVDEVHKHLDAVDVLGPHLTGGVEAAVRNNLLPPINNLLPHMNNVLTGGVGAAVRNNLLPHINNLLPPLINLPDGRSRGR